MGRIVASWQEGNIKYTITAEEVQVTGEMLTLFDYLGGKTPERGTGDKVYKAAVAAGAVISSKEVFTKSYTGKVMMYERSFLDSYFNGLELAAYTPKPMTVPADTMSTYEDDDLPF